MPLKRHHCGPRFSTRQHLTVRGGVRIKEQNSSKRTKWLQSQSLVWSGAMDFVRTPFLWFVAGRPSHREKQPVRGWIGHPVTN